MAVFLSRFLRMAPLLAVACAFAPDPARAVAVMNRDVAAGAGGLLSGGGFQLGMTVGECVVGLALDLSTPRAELAGFWAPIGVTVLAAGDLPAMGPVPADLLQVTPNPFARTTVLRFALRTDAEAARAAIYDARGRRVRRLEGETAPGGTVSFTWDGRDDSGSETVAGIYFCRVEAEGISATRRFARVR